MSIILTYQDSHSVDHVITLPNPDFSDSISVNYIKFITESRGKELIIGKKSGYDSLPKILRIKYPFSYISEKLKQELFVFLDISFGRLIQINDYNANVWQSIITNAVEITNTSRNNNSFTIEAEIIYYGLLEGPWPITQGLLSPLEMIEGYGG